MPAVSHTRRVEHSCDLKAPYLPTPEEIEAAKAQIRAGWSQPQENARACHHAEPADTRVVADPSAVINNAGRRASCD